MDCEDCDRFVNLYKQAISRYSAFAETLATLSGNDFALGVAQAQKFRRICAEINREFEAHLAAKHSLHPLD